MREPIVDSKQSVETQNNQKRDIAVYFVEEGDPGFSPDRNKAVIAESIRKSKEVRRKILVKELDEIRERTDAVATYLKSRMAEGSSSVEKYFGKRYLAHLRGQKIMNVMRTNLQNQQRQVYLPK